MWQTQQAAVAKQKQKAAVAKSKKTVAKPKATLAMKEKSSKCLSKLDAMEKANQKLKSAALELERKLKSGQVLSSRADPSKVNTSAYCCFAAYLTCLSVVSGLQKGIRRDSLH